jgi:hypothetical protein
MTSFLHLQQPQQTLGCGNLYAIARDQCAFNCPAQP